MTASFNCSAADLGGTSYSKYTLVPSTVFLFVSFNPLIQAQFSVKWSGFLSILGTYWPSEAHALLFEKIKAGITRCRVRGGHSSVPARAKPAQSRSVVSNTPTFHVVLCLIVLNSTSFLTRTGFGILR